MPEKINISDKRALWGLITAILSGILFDRVVFNGFSGLGYSLFMTVTIILYFIMLRDNLVLKGNMRLLWLLPIGAMIFQSTIYDNQVIHGLNILVIPVFMTAAAIIIRFRSVEYDRPIFIIDLWYHMFLLPLLNIGKPFSAIKRLLPSKKSGKRFKVNSHVLTGILLSIPLLLIVLAFLSSADMMFNYYVEEFFKSFRFLENFEISDATLGHIFLVSVIAIYFFAFVWGFAGNNKSLVYENDRLEIEPLTISIPVSLLNIIYLLFSAVQFSYLYGGGKLPSGFTYAEYARRGFFELVAVTVINFSIVVIGVNKSKVSDKKMNLICNILYTLLVFFTLNMLYSANYKMRLYENTYGYTYLRVYVHLFMILLLILNATALIVIWYKKINLYKVALISGVLFYALVNMLNVDAYIASENIKVYRQNGKIDARYLTSLSDDAVPYLIELSGDTSPEVGGIIREDLNKRRERLNNSENSSNPLKFNFSKEHARKLLE